MAAMKSRLLHFLAVVVLAALAGGCLYQPERKLTGSGMDMFAPFTMRLHPLSRFVPHPDGLDLEVRVEFTDQMGDVTKGVGILHLVVADPPLLPGVKGQEILAWDADISTPDANKAAWDPITRTYLFRRKSLAPGVFLPGRQVLLSATLTFPNATGLNAELPLTVPKPR